MNTLRLLLAALVASVVLGFGAPALAATGNMVQNPNIRGVDGKLLPSKLSTAPQGAEVYIANTTGETLTTPTAAVIKSATLSLCPQASIRGSTTICTPADASITLKKSGLYRVEHCTSGTTSAAATLDIMLFRKDGAETVAEESPTLRVTHVTPTGGTGPAVCAAGHVTVTAAQAAATGGQVFDVRATASTGNLVVKNFRFSMYKIDELSPAQP